MRSKWEKSTQSAKHVAWHIAVALKCVSLIRFCHRLAWVSVPSQLFLGWAFFMAYLLLLLFFFKFFFFFNIYLFLRQRETEHEQGRVRKRGRHRIGNRLQALSGQHRARRGARTHGPRDHDLIWSQTLNRPSHPGAPGLSSLYPWDSESVQHFSPLISTWSLCEKQWVGGQGRW